MAERRKVTLKKFIVGICILTGICLIGAAAAVFAALRQRNPLAAGLAGLAEEMMAREAELGENFWTDVLDQAGSGNVQAEYSLNIGGIPALQNITVGLDGETKRDMERQLFETDFRVSVTNAEIAEASVYGTSDSLLVQVPSIWNGSVVFDVENVSGQWDDSITREQLQRLTGMELGIYRRIDAGIWEGFSVEPFSVAGFLRDNAEGLKALYENMEAVKTEKAKRDGMLGEDQAKELESCIILDAEENQIETVCYLVVLPGKELGDIFPGVTGDIRLGVYLDQDRRIVRISTVPGEVLEMAGGEIEIGVNLAGAVSTIDRLDITAFGVVDADKMNVGLLEESGEKIETECSFIIEKESDEIGSYDIEGELVLTYQDHVWELSGEGSVQGERYTQGKRLSVDVENLTLRSAGDVTGRFSGNIMLEPLADHIELPAGKEYRIEKMSEAETLLFLAECVENVYKNYAGYLKMVQ